MKSFFEKKIVFLKPNEIVFHTKNIRAQETEITELADNIRVNGMTEPLIVRKTKSGSYELVCGKRRLIASKVIGLRRVPCIVKEIDVKTASTLKLSENLLTKKESCFKTAELIESYMLKFSLSTEEAAENLGVSQSFINKKLNLLKIDPLTQLKMTSNEIPERNIRYYLSLDSEKREDYLNFIINSLNKTVGKVHKESEEAQTQGQTKKAVISDNRLLSNSVSKFMAAIKCSGIEAYSQRIENEKYTEYKIRIPKNQNDSYKQLKLV